MSLGVCLLYMNILLIFILIYFFCLLKIKILVGGILQLALVVPLVNLGTETCGHTRALSYYLDDSVQDFRERTRLFGPIQTS